MIIIFCLYITNRQAPEERGALGRWVIYATTRVTEIFEEMIDDARSGRIKVLTARPDLHPQSEMDRRIK